jgi:lysozyme family protein
MKAPPLSDLLASAYFNRFGHCVPDPARHAEMDATLDRIFAHQDRYEKVANKLPAPPWFVVALIHYREADLDFTTHLFNGDPLARPTVNEPKGQPPGNGPFTWEESAWAALRWDKMDKLVYSNTAQIAWALENYNGWGYFERHTVSPYLWAGSDQYTTGKFVSDGHYSPTFVDQQLGAMTLLRHAINRGRIALRGTQVLPHPL